MAHRSWIYVKWGTWSCPIVSIVDFPFKCESVYDFYAKQTKNKDKYFSIYRDIPGVFRLGQTNIQIDDDNNLHMYNRSQCQSGFLEPFDAK